MTNSQNLLNMYRPKMVNLNCKPSMMIKMLGDKEKYVIAKADGNFDLLIELIQSDEQAFGRVVS